MKNNSLFKLAGGFFASIFAMFVGLLYAAVNSYADSTGTKKNLIASYKDNHLYKAAIDNALNEKFVGSGTIKRKKNRITKQFMFEVYSAGTAYNVAHKLVLSPGYVDVLRVCPLDATTHKYVEIGGDAILGSNNNQSEVKHNDTTKFSGSGIAGVTAVLDDGLVYSSGTGAATLTITPKGFSIRDFLAYIKKNPSVIEKISISCSNAQFFDGEIRVKTLNPFDSTGDKQLQLGDFLDLNQQVQTRIDVVPAKKNMIVQLDDQTVVTMTIPAPSNLGVTSLKATIQIDFCEVANYAEDVFADFGGIVE